MRVTDNFYERRLSEKEIVAQFKSKDARTCGVPAIATESPVIRLKFNVSKCGVAFNHTQADKRNKRENHHSPIDTERNKSIPKTTRPPSDYNLPISIYVNYMYRLFYSVGR